MAYSSTWDETLSWPSDRRRRDAARMRIEWLAWLLDTALVIPGTRIRLGLDPILGLVPGVGDALATLLALWLVLEARQIGAPTHVIVRMLGNIAVDAAIGWIPVVGDLFDVAFKANRRNREVLRRHMGI